MLNNLYLMTGVDVPILECQLILHQPTIKEISFIGEETYFTGLQCICIQKSMYEDQLQGLEDQISNFILFVNIMQQKELIEKRKAVNKVFQLLFPNYQSFITSRSIVFNQQQENLTIDESNFEAFQTAIMKIACMEESAKQSFNPANKKAKEIAEKLQKGRQKVAEQQAKQGEDSIFSRYLSILTVGLNSMSFADLLNLTCYQLYDLIERYSLYINWDLDVRTRLAGGKPDSEPENWMKSLHSKN